MALVEDGEVLGSRQLDMGNSGLVGGVVVDDPTRLRETERVIVDSEGHDVAEISDWTETEQLVLCNEVRDSLNTGPAGGVYAYRERSVGRHGSGSLQAALTGHVAVFWPVFQPAAGEVYAEVPFATTREQR